MALHRFEVLAGAHSQDGHVFHKGEIVTSATDLCAQFINKFRRLDVAEPTVQSVAQEVGMLVGGPGPATAQDSPPIVAGQGKATSGEGKPQESQPTAPTGKDVTAQFEKAAEQDFKVFKRDGKFFVYDGDNLSKPVNAEGVVKAAVDGVVAGALK